VSRRAASPRRPPVATPRVALDSRMVATCRADAAEFSGPHIRSRRHRFAFRFSFLSPVEARRAHSRQRRRSPHLRAEAEAEAEAEAMGEEGARFR